MQAQATTGYRLSPQQRWRWPLQQYYPAVRAQGAVLLEGLLDPRRLREAVDRVVARHEILRTTFFRPAGMKTPFQIIAERGAAAWREVDLRDLPEAEQDARIEQIRREDARRPFAFDQGPLLQLTLAAMSAEKHLLILNLPSLCADLRTLGNLVREIGHFYAADAVGEAIPAEPLQYADYAQWQRELLEAEDEDARSGRAYWEKGPFSSAAPVRLPLERKPHDPQAFEPESVEASLSSRQAVRIEQAAGDCGVSAEAFLLACWQTLLWRVTGQPDLLAAVVGEGRREDDLREAMGPFARWLPASGRFDDGMPFVEFVRRADRMLREGAEWEDYCTWEETLRADGEDRDWPIAFELAAWPPDREAGGVRFSMVRQYAYLNRFKLQVSCAWRDRGLAVMMHYDPARLDDENVRRLAGSFAALAESAAADPETPIDRLEILGEAERRLLAEFSPGETIPLPDRCIHQWFEEQVERTPQQPAMVFEDQRWTFAELNARANRLAHYLRACGVKAGVCVGLCVDRSPEMIVGLLGILKAGGAYVALNPEYPKKRLAHQLEEIEAPVVLTQEPYRDHLPEFAGRTVLLDGDTPRWADQPEENPPCITTPDDPVYVMYTSGSTGLPKGVVVSHRSLVNYTQHVCRRLRLAEHGGLQFATVSTITADLGNTCIYPSLVSGGCLHVLSYDVAAEGDRFADYLARHPIDVLKIVPSHFRALWAACRQPDRILPRRYLIFGGEALSYELIDAIAPVAGGCEVINHYGPTETTVGSLMGAVDLRGDSPRRSATVPIGRPIANTTVFILDAHRRPVPVGVSGELYIGGAGVARGYWKQPERTSERFLPHPLSGDSSDRVYKTGDRVRFLPDGQVEFLGRTDHQVKIRGYRVELEEIEAVLNRHEAVRQAVVLAREDEPGHKRLVAYVASSRQPGPDVEALQALLKDELPHYMVPSAFVLLDQMPLTRNGKVDRQALLALEETTARPARSYVAPRTETEKVLAGIWAQVLGREQVGIYDNFFSDLGGDSILSIQIIARANQAGLRLLPKQIFEHQTIAELASVAGTAAAVEAEQGLVTGPVPLTPIQHWFFEQDFAEPHHWNQAVFFEVRQALEPRHLTRIVHHLLAHHDALRLRFHREASGWQQTCAALDPEVPVLWIDLSSVPEGRRKAAIEAAASQVQRSMDLSEGPLMRVVYFHLGPEKPGRLLIVIHHLAVDGVSWRILLEDLQLAYTQVAEGQEIRLPAKTTSFKTWASKLVEYAGSDALRREAGYWLRGPRSGIRPLPKDFAEGANRVASSQTVSIALEPEETRALLEEIPEVYQTQINDVLLTALVLAFSRWSGARALLVDLEGHGREELFEGVALWRTVGWFTTHFPVHLELAAASSPGDALKTVKEQLRAAANHGIGYGLLRYLSPDEEIRRRLEALPQPEVSFNYLGQFDQVLSDSSLLAPAPERMGPLQSPKGHRSHLLYVIGSVTGGRLRLGFTYSEDVFRRTSIEELAGEMAAELRAILAHCRSPEAGGYTPSDFSLAGLDQERFGQVSRLIDEMDASENGESVEE